jgi:hypothetical protein
LEKSSLSSALASDEALADSDLILILERKNDQLKQWVELSQQQLAIREPMEPAELELLLGRKEQLMEELRKLDQLMESWGARHRRPPNYREVRQLRLSARLLEQIQEAENSFMTRLQKDRQELSREIGQLRNQVNYIQPGAGRAGRLMNLRRHNKA